MRQVFQKSYLSPDLCVEEIPVPVLKGCGVLVENRASLISPGTERATVSFARKNLLAKIQSQPERVALLFRKMKQMGIKDTLLMAKRKLETPIPLGYSSAGVVREVSPDLKEFRLGDRVACAGAQYASHAEVVYIPKNLCVPLPASVTFEEGSFVAPGAIALHGVRQAEIGLGETVAVIGLGLIGLLAAQLVKAQGGIPVGIDLEPERLAMAQQLGITYGLNRQDPALISTLQALTQGQGVDKVIVAAAAASNDPVMLAGEIARDRAKVVIVGDVGMQIPRSLYYHKELSVVVSRSYGPGRYDPAYEEQGQAYPKSYVRWTERENMQAFLQLVARGQVSVLPLIQQRFPVERAEMAYDLLVDPNRRPQPVGIILEYPQPAPAPMERKLSLHQANPHIGQIGLGVIGAGNFLRSVLLPEIKKCPEIQRVGLANQSGLSAKTTGESFGFTYCTTDTDIVLADEQVQLVVIGTRHDSHADLLCRALAQGKHVFVEKPLATCEAELAACIEAVGQAPQQQVMVGFNRRFSSLSQTLKSLVTANPTRFPLSIHYRVNAGPVPEDSWLHQHGGRIVGEMCHFIDWCLFLTGEMPIEVTAQQVSVGVNQDVSVQLRFSGGSVAQIQYWMQAEPALGKERIEVSAPTLSAILDDFQTLTYQQNGKVSRKALKKQDKGFYQQWQALVHAIKQGSSSPIPWNELVATTQTTFAVLEAIRRQQPISLTPWEG